jgi:biotin carboxylase
MKNKKIAIIGADGHQLPLVQKAKEMGIEIHCFDQDKNAHTRCKEIADYFHPISVFEKEQILEKCREIKIDGVTSKSNELYIPIVAYVAENMGLPGNRYEDMLIAINKFSRRQAFEQHGVKSPRFALAHEKNDLSEFQYPLVVKPADCAKGTGVVKVEKEEDLQEAIRQAQELSVRKEVIIEEFIEGLESGVDIISCNGEHHILAVKEREMFFDENHCLQKKADHYPLELPAHIEAKIKDETKKALNAIHFNYGASKAKFILTKENEWVIIDINPKMGGHNLLKAHNGYEYIKGLIDVALGQFEKPVFQQKKYTGHDVCRENTDVIRQAIENKDKDPDIVSAVMYKEKYSGKIGFFNYHSDIKRRWK